jgi:hypothetical protein
MHALPLLAALVDRYLIFLRHVGPRTIYDTRFGDEPNPEARLSFARRRASEPTRPR